MPRFANGHPTRVALALLALLGVISTIVVTSLAPVASADTPGNPIVTKATTSHQTNVSPGTPLTGLVDGDVITVDVTATGAGTSPANEIIYAMDARLCRSGLEIELVSQFNASGGNCIGYSLSPLSSSIVQAAYAAPNTSGTLSFIVGTGTETEHVGPGTPITCNFQNPCSLWLRQYVPTGLVDGGNAFVHFDLNFAAPPSAPGAPTGVVATPGNGQATVAWTAPVGANPAITGYTVTSAPGGKTCTTAGALSCVVTGLTNGTPHTFTAVATNTLGTGPASSPSAAVTPVPASVPGAPTAVTGTGGDTTATISWAAPGSDGGSPVTGYTVTSSPGDKTCTTAALSCVVTGLTNGADYTFTVQATNAVGTGAASAPSGVVVPLIPLSFSDVPADSLFYADIQWAAGTGITTGNTDGTFAPLAGTTRQSIAAFLYRFAGSPNGADPQCSTAAFTDVPADHVFCGEIQWMVDEDIAAGFVDGSFKPGNPMTRQAMAAFLYRYAGSPDGVTPTCSVAPFTDVAANHVFCGEITWLSLSGITTGFLDGSFKPGNVVPRQAVAAYLHRMNDL